MNSEKALYVPMEVSALAIDRYTRLNQEFHRFKMQYENLEKMLSPEPLPYAATDDDFSTNPNNEGIYLHWTLPSCFRKAEDKQSGVLDYPVVPNRWAVFRKPISINRYSSNQSDAWIVESDAIDTTDGSPYLLLDKNQCRPTRIGHYEKLESWSEQRENDPMFLTVTGSGDPTFAAFQPGCKNVFSFHDSLEGIEEAELNYMVIGWFANNKYDPLYGINTLEEFLSKVKELGWEVDDRTQIATRTFIKGSVSQVSWKRVCDSSPYPENEKLNQQVVLGLTSKDTLAELLGSYAPRNDYEQILTQLLEVFQYDLLGIYEEQGEEERIDDEVHKSGFYSKPGGFIWKIADTEKPAKELNQLVRLSKAEKNHEEDILTKLNQNQQQLDRLIRLKESCQQRLYEAWWKDKYRCIWGYEECDGKHSESNGLNFNIGVYRKFIAQLLLEVPYGRTQKELKESIACFKNKNGISPERKLIRIGMPRFWIPNNPVVMISGFQKSISKLRQDKLNCRLIGTDESILESVSCWNSNNLPFNISAILFEQDLPPNLPWQQPWEPLFIEWQADWYPIPYEKWSFDGRDLQIDSTSPISYQTIEGRTILGSHSIYSLKSQLERYIVNNPQDVSPEFKNFVASIEKWDILSQSLGGLNEALILRSIRMQPMPCEHFDVGNQVFTMPDPQSLDDVGGTLFQPIRGGYLKMKRLTIVDRFGIAKDVPLSTMLLAESLRTEDDQLQMAELKPRIMQNVRLNFHWISGLNDTQEVNLYKDANPICGWVVLNYLDHGLSIYNPCGMLLGEIRVIGKLGGNKKAKWESAPQLTEGYSYLKGSDPHLHGFIDGLIKGDNQALEDFMKVIDESLWVIDPKGLTMDKSRALLFGRPLALVRSKIEFELDGWHIVHPKDSAILSIPDYIGTQYKIALGNWRDGLIGYYLGKDYRQLNCVHMPPEASTKYLKLIGGKEPTGENNYFSLSLRVEVPQYLTLLMDPLSKIHAYSGILPVKEIELSEDLYRDALTQMEVLFHMGPILTALVGEDGKSKQIVLPQPSEKLGDWVWHERTNNPDEPWVSYSIMGTDNKDFPTRTVPTIREGLLQLTLPNTKE